MRVFTFAVTVCVSMGAVEAMLSTSEPVVTILTEVKWRRATAENLEPQPRDSQSYDERSELGP